MAWAPAPQKREQMVLFSRSLDDAVAPDHAVRLCDELLGRLDWTAWERAYDGVLGQPAIHPRVLAALILYGLLVRIRSSRKLEEAPQVRLDFLWLLEGRTIDHTTISKFRQQHAAELKGLFVQVGLLARQLGWLALEQLAYDGTRLRANNRRSGTRTPAELQEAQAELARKFAELEAQAAAEDARDEEAFAAAGARATELADVARRREQVDAALAELARMQAAGETIPQRLPLTDPQSRVTPNKEGGFAPNYTPLATVDAGSGLIVAVDVISSTNEDVHLLPQLAAVQEDFGLSAPPPELLADGAMPTGPNLAALEAAGVTLFAPIPLPDPANPAFRDDPRQPVPPEQWDRLPMTRKKKSQLDKSAFVYDAEEDCYWCPQGQPLPRVHQTSEARGGGRAERGRYKADPAACAACPLFQRCVQPGAKQRQVTRDQHDDQRARLARRMAQPEAQTKYQRRREVAERPFATIKEHFGARRFLLRGLDRVRTEWRWLATAFNLHRLMALLRSARAGPAPPPIGAPL